LLFGHDALDRAGLALLVDQKLTDAAVPGSDIGEEFLQAFDAAIREGGYPSGGGRLTERGWRG
jgi:hypothetical protein